MQPSTNEQAIILAVDDQPDNIHLFRMMLEPQGYEIWEALSGEDALAVLQKGLPDIVLLDLALPGMSGLEVVERLKQDGRARHVPVIMVTGTGDHDANVRAIEMGADDFLSKPIDRVLLEARIRNSLRTKRLRDQLLQHRQQLETKIRERTLQLERTQHVTVYSLAKLAESRDNETGEHLNRMRCYAREVALELGVRPEYSDEIDPGFVDELFHSSPLHDIGKVGIPDMILLKPGRLTPEEFEIMKAHSTIGGDTLRAADLEAGEGSFLAMGRDIAYYHHERWDGSGYPMGLRGREIPLAARIVAVADVYDALTSKRPYKEAFPHEKAMGIMKEARGTHFDPVVFDAFLERENECVAICETLQDNGVPSHIHRLVLEMERRAAEKNPDSSCSV